MSTPLSELETQREHLKRQLSGLGDLRPGSLVERYRKCGKPNCHWSLVVAHSRCERPDGDESYSRKFRAANPRADRRVPAAARSDTRSSGRE